MKLKFKWRNIMIAVIVGVIIGVSLTPRNSAPVEIATPVDEMITTPLFDTPVAHAEEVEEVDIMHTRYAEKQTELYVSNMEDKFVEVVFEYTVKGGDTLYSIAEEVYGDGELWPLIWEMNQDLLSQDDPRNIDDPGHWIYAGQVLTITGGQVVA